MTKNPSKSDDHAWFALTDAESCRLLCCRLTKQGTQHVEEYDAIENTLPEQEHIRPMTNAGTTHNVENNERRFAGVIVNWLQKQAERHEIERLVILAPPRMLGVLRMIPLGSLRGRVEELRGDLMRLNAGQLAEHPMVRKLVAERQGGASSESTVISADGGKDGNRLDQPDGRCRTA